jgi:hypothetical protein
MTSTFFTMSASCLRNNMWMKITHFTLQCQYTTTASVLYTSCLMSGLVHIQFFPSFLGTLIFPQKYAPPTELFDLQPLPVTARYDGLYTAS